MNYLARRTLALGSSVIKAGETFTADESPRIIELLACGAIIPAEPLAEEPITPAVVDPAGSLGEKPGDEKDENAPPPDDGDPEEDPEASKGDPALDPEGDPAGPPKAE